MAKKKKIIANKADDEKPATKGDVKNVKNEMKAEFANVRTETKAEFARQRAQTSSDIRSAVDELAQATKAGFDEMRGFIEKKFTETMDHFDAVAENIHQDVAGANRDEIRQIKDK